jgi:hypothetical protein
LQPDAANATKTASNNPTASATPRDFRTGDDLELGPSIDVAELEDGERWSRKAIG